ncbi:hypothetical protein [Mucilaginibacter celer]|uniref:Lipoprotein n=1 Tax=Mucilaginibacter celer TaxID=2305508 RepID=A0A494VM83_9SPHI|nr:hypothetical protein [Mucilaginibacter celer]AYL95219.1 hypothetical protein HYN43_007880 [Mucilaginibacter celer]
MKKVIRYTGTLAALTTSVFACNSGDSHKQINNSQDTTSVNKAGGPAIRDTTTINKDRHDSAIAPATDSMSKGNADPSVHMSAKPIKK